MRRVVVTGMGLLSPLGYGVEHVWRRLIAGESGIRKITHFDVSDLPCQIGGIIPRGTSPGDFDVDSVIPPKDQRKNDIFIHYGIAAAEEAIRHSGYAPQSDEARERTGVLIGSGIGGLGEIFESTQVLVEKGPRRISPFFIPASLINLISGQVSIKHDFRGPNHAVVTACSTGAHAIGDAARMIMLGDADAMVAGGSEAAINRLGMAGFAAARALSTGFNDRPTEASRPYDQDRDGFVMGEGAGAVMLEEYEHAKKRGATIYAEVIGYGMSGDAHHITAPHPEGRGAFLSMKNAVARAGIAVDDIHYVNAHGTSTPLGDEIEIGAVKKLLGSAVGSVTVSSTKSATGHMLGAAGAAEAIFSILAIRDGICPPTLNLHHPSESCLGIDLAPLRAVEKPVRVALSNSFGFGGTNASLVFRAV